MLLGPWGLGRVGSPFGGWLKWGTPIDGNVFLFFEDDLPVEDGNMRQVSCGMLEQEHHPATGQQCGHVTL